MDKYTKEILYHTQKIQDHYNAIADSKNAIEEIVVEMADEYEETKNYLHDKIENLQMEIDEIEINLNEKQ